MSRYVKKVIDSFLEGKPKKVNNAETDGSNLYLHGNKIAKREFDGLWITTYGWNTRTTRDRLSMLPDIYVSSRKGQLFLKIGNNEWEKWDGLWKNIE